MAGENIFRIGGDEFCIILENSSVAEYQKAIEHMERLCREYNETAESVQMYIAYGYAVYDGNQDAGLKETRSRADSMMYERKFRMKQEQKGNTASAEDDR
jgi:diguanylate cyclase (GGDEF)-like protein